MTDITYSKTMTVRRVAQNVVTGNGSAYKSIVHTATIELAASASGTTIKVGRFPSNARIHGLGKLYADDLATSGSPTLSIGVSSVNNNIAAAVPAALTDSIALSAAVTGANLVKDIANFGKMLWEHAGAATDPGGELDIYATVKAAATNAAGTITQETVYTLD